MRARLLTSVCLAALLPSPAAAASHSGADHAQRLDAAARSAVIEQALGALERQYVFPEVAAKMAARVRERQTQGGYERLEDPAHFARALTEDLRSVSADRHLRILHARSEPSGRGNLATSRASGERLDGNIGYLRIDLFPSASRFAASLDPLMTSLASTDALIIDLRENRGGVPDAVMYLMGYLLPGRTLIARIYSRPDDTTSEMWSTNIPGAKYVDKPVYILTSGRTFSAGEAAAYHLKHLGRAQTIGEPSGGAAHRVLGVELRQGFVIDVPIARPISVVTNGNWEGVGVIPDVAVPAAEALRTAHIRALQALPASPAREAALDRLRRSGPVVRP